MALEWRFLSYRRAACSVEAVAAVTESGSDSGARSKRSDVDNEISPSSNAASSSDGSALTLRDDDKPVRVADRAGDVR